LWVAASCLGTAALIQPCAEAPHLPCYDTRSSWISCFHGASLAEKKNSTHEFPLLQGRRRGFE